MKDNNIDFAVRKLDDMLAELANELELTEAECDEVARRFAETNAE